MELDALSLGSKISALKQLKEHVGWKLVEELLRQNINLRINEVCGTPVGGAEELAKENYAKGELGMAHYIQGAPDFLIEGYEAEREALKQKDDDDGHDNT